MLPDRRVQEALRNFVFVEWRYDGKFGKVTQWTRKHGDPNPADPCILGWVLDAEEKELAGPADGFFKDPETLAEKLVDIARSGKGPGIAFLLVDAQPAVPRAEEAKEPVLLYLCRAGESEPKAFASKRVQKLAKGLSCLKLELNAKANAAYARTLGVEEAPAVVLIPPKGEKVLLAKEKLTAAALEAELDKLAKAPGNPLP